MDIQTLSKRIQERREALQISQNELSELIGTHQQQVSRWESGLSRPRADFLASLAETLQTTPNYLLGFTHDPDPAAEPTTLTAEEQELLDTYRQLPNRQRELMRFVRFISHPE